MARRLVPVLGFGAIALLLRPAAGEGSGPLEVCRHPDADGRGARRVDLVSIQRAYRSIAEETTRRFGRFEANITRPRDIRHRTRIPGCRSAGLRTVRLAQVVPPGYRTRTLYFVHARKDGGRPDILPDRLPGGAEIFVLRADSARDLSNLAKVARHRVTLATAAFVRAVGVRCADAEVTFSKDGRLARVREAAP